MQQVHEHDPANIGVSVDGSGQVYTYVGARVGRSGWVKLIGEGWIISGGWMCVCRSRGGSN